MFKAIVFSCLHYSLKQPIMRTENYGELILNKLKWILDFANDKKAMLLFTGDLFHRKYGVTFKEVNMLMETIGDNKIYGILGNHDVQGYYAMNTDVLPIGVLIKAKKFIPMPEHTYFMFDGVAITGKHYCINYDVPETYDVMVKDCDYHIHLTHGMLTNKKTPYDSVSVNQVEVNADILVNGHNHGFWQDEERKIINIGSIARVAMDNNEINKQPKILYIEGKKTSFIDVPIEKDVWLSEVKRETLDADEVEKFAKSIKEMELSSDEEILKEILKNESEEIQKRVCSYLEEKE